MVIISITILNIFTKTLLNEIILVTEGRVPIPLR